MSWSEKILNFWFEGVTDQIQIRKKIDPFRKWFRSTRDLDEYIKEAFEGNLTLALKGQLELKSIDDYMASIVLFDQLTRNMYRHSPKAYCADHLAQQNTLAMIQNEQDVQVDLIQRVFIYMPLMHAEQMELQSQSVRMFEKLVHDCERDCPDNINYYQSQLTHAHKYYKIIQRFGRFPHRNAVLNRTSTNDEQEFLQR